MLAMTFEGNFGETNRDVMEPGEYLLFLVNKKRNSDLLSTESVANRIQVTNTLSDIKIAIDPESELPHPYYSSNFFDDFCINWENGLTLEQERLLLAVFRDNCVNSRKHTVTISGQEVASLQDIVNLIAIKNNTHLFH